MAVSEARDRFADVVDKVRRTHEPVHLTRHGKPAAVLVDPDDYEPMAAALPRPKTRRPSPPATRP